MAKEKRPVIITVICILGFLGVLFAIPKLFSDITQSVGSWYPPYVALNLIVGITCFIGLWMMKKWSIIAYTIVVAINQAVLIRTGLWNPFALVMPGIVIVIGFSKFKELK